MQQSSGQYGIVLHAPISCIFLQSNEQLVLTSYIFQFV